MSVAPVLVPRPPIGVCPCHHQSFNENEEVYEHCGSFYKKKCLTELAKGTIFVSLEAVSPAHAATLIDTSNFVSWRERIANAVSIHPLFTTWVPCCITPVLSGAATVIATSNKVIIISSVPLGIVLGCCVGGAFYVWGKRIRNSYLTGPRIPRHLLESSRTHLLSSTRI